MVLEKIALSHFRKKRDFGNIQKDVFFLSKMTETPAIFSATRPPKYMYKRNILVLVKKSKVTKSRVKKLNYFGKFRARSRCKGRKSDFYVRFSLDPLV